MPSFDIVSQVNSMEIENAVNTANPTDPAKIALLAERLHDMFRSRRQNGNLSREELAAVSAMSWFHFTLDAKAHLQEMVEPHQQIVAIFLHLQRLPLHNRRHRSLYTGTFHHDVLDAFRRPLADLRHQDQVCATK